MSLRGYSYYQKGRLDELQAESLKRLKEVGDKVWDYDYDAEIGKLDDKDEEHFDKIMFLKNDKVVLADYEAKVTQMTTGDTTRHMALNNLDNEYGQKASKMVFDNVVTELRALDDNHEMRLDELEKRLGATQVDLDDRITQELNQKINSTEFEAMLSNVNAGQTGLAQDITNLLMTPEMLQLNADQDAEIALKADKAQFDADSAAIASRHYDFEKRFLAIDQFFRLMAKTYKLTEKSNGNEIIYDAIPKNIKLDKLFTVDEKRTGRLILKLTGLYAYNIFTNKISVVNGSNNPLGFGVKSDFNPMTLTGNISITGEIIFPLKVQFLNLAGDVLYEDDVTDVEYLGLPNPSLVAIGYGTEAYNFTAGVAITINPTIKTGTFGTAVIKQAPSWLTINKDTGVISVTADSTAGQYSYQVEVTSQDGFEKATTTVTINITNPIVSGFRTFGNTPMDVTSDGIIYAQAIAPNGDIYIGGAFLTINGILCNNIAKWSSSTTANGGWSPLGTGLDNSVRTIAIGTNGDVYVGGDFTTANSGSVVVRYIAKWSLSTTTNGGWSPLGAGLNKSVRTIAINSQSNDVYVGGDFITTNSGSVVVRYIAKWSTSTTANGEWSPLGNGLSGSVYAIAINSQSGDVYVGGDFITANSGSIVVNRIAKWSNETWSPLGTGLNNGVRTIAINSQSDDVYVGGYFTTANSGTVNVRYIAKWSNGTWSALGTGLSGSVNAIAIGTNGDIYVGGAFTTANSGSVVVNRIAKWSTSTTANGEWSPLGNGLNSFVYAIAIKSQSNDVYVGGEFTTANDINTGCIVRYSINDGNWNNILDTILRNGMIYAQAIAPNGDIYIGGAFRAINGIVCNNIAKWSSSTTANGGWSALGTGLNVGTLLYNSVVYAIAINSQSGDVYVGGIFTTANSGSIAVDNIAKWSNETWSPLGTGLDNSVRTIAIGTNGDVYVGGDFITANSGSVVVRYIAKWSLSTTTNGGWSPLGAGLNKSVRTIAINSQSNDVYVGGDFITTNSGSVVVRYIAKWSNETWSPLGNGLSGSVRTIAINSQSNDVYVGGDFTTANSGSIVVNHIAKWSLSGGWSPLGNGLSSSVYAIAINSQNGDVYVGGAFTAANSGSNVVNRIAKWSLSTTTNGGWSALGTGLNSIVRAIAINSQSGDVYIGGAFTGVNVASTTSETAWAIIKYGNA